MEADARSDNEDQDSVVGSPEELSKKRKVDASPTSGERKSKGNKRVRGIDDQAEESGDDEEDENSDDGSGNEDDGGQDNYVYNDNFLVPDDVRSDDSGESRDRSRAKSKKNSLKSLKKQKGNLQLDDDDLLLVRDAQENSYKSSKAPSGAKSRVDDRDDDEIAPIEGRKRSNTHDSDGEDEGEEDGADGDAMAGNNKSRRPQSSYYNDDDEGSDMGGFIVDEDSDEGEENGEGGASKASRRASGDADGRTQHPHQITHRRTGRSDKPTFDQIQDAEDIFGAGYDDNFSDGEEEDDENDSDAEDALDGRVTTDKLLKMNMNKDGEYLEGLGGEQIELSRKDKKRIQRLRNRFERSNIVATFCTERDDLLRRVDRPERLQEVLVGRDTPQEAERVLEAKWMAAKLAAKIVADDHLNSNRASVPHTANPVAAQRSDLYFMQSDEEKEQRLKEELEESILHVLRFLQVEQWEVPFIWNYRRDYLHPVMTRELLWTVFELEEGWDTVVATKMRLSDEVSAVQDAAEVAGGRNAAQSDAALLTRLQSDLRRLTSTLESLNSDVRLAEAEEKEAMDLVDEKEEPTAEDRQRVATASAELESLQEQFRTMSVQLQELKEEEVQQQARLQRRSQFRPSAAKEVMRLFPVDRYLSIVRDTTDDTELRDVLRFFRLLAQNAEVGGGSGEGEEDEEEVGESQDADGEAGTSSSTNATKPRKFVKKGLRQHKDEYAKYKDLPAVRRIVELVGVPASAFGDALRHGFKVEPPPTSELTSAQLAKQLIESGAAGKAFKTDQQLLRAARMVLATELSMEPTVRGAARAIFKRLATVSTRPTAKGTSVITPFSEYFGLHYLHRKPLADFYSGAARTLFVRLVEAERLGLITVSIDLPYRQSQVEKKATDGTVTFETVDAPDHSPFITGELKLMQQFMPLLIVDEDMFPDSRLSWDTERLVCLNVCVEQLLCPSLQKEFRRDLIRLGKEAIVQEAARNFSKTLTVGPYVPPYQDDRERVKDLLKACPNRPFYGSVASIYISLGRDEPLCMAFVNRDGVLRAHDLVPAQAMNQKNDRIRKFLVENRPDLIVLNSSGASATRSTCILVEKNILKEVEEEIKRRDAARRDGRIEGLNYADEDEEFVPYRAQVMIVKDELARIFQNSDRRKKMFPELQPAEAAAVCLARYAQEPLAEYCSAWNAASSQETFGYELLFLPVHPLKSLLKGAQQALLNALECRLVDAVCDVGVDINKACAYDHIAPMLAFVGGLGLRKADALRQNIRKSAKAITSRNDLLLRKLLGSCVWTNAAGFVRICDNVMDPLDNTRIHPECYTTHDFATKICADALEVAHSNSDYVANVEKLMASTRRVLEKRMDKHRTWLDLWEGGQRPIHGVTEYNETVRTVDGREHPLGVELGDILSQLELDDYAVELEESGQGKRRLLFEQIKDELRFPWLDLRLPLAAVTPSEMFFLLTGETDQSLYVGMKVGGTVTEISDTSFRDENTDQYKRRQRATVQTDAGLRGYIGMYDVEDTPEYQRFDVEKMNLADHMQVGQHIEAVVVAVKKDRLQLDLSIKPSFLNKPESWWMEQRCELKQAREWWSMQGRDPSKLFDPYFLERQALRACADEEASQQKSTETINQQLTAASINGVRSGAGGAEAGGASGAGRSLMRVVHHPLFANLDFKAAEERMRLEGKGAGEVLIRPSSKGPNFLTITWAFQDNWYKHISVEEKGKRAGDLGLGTQLLVQEDDITEAYNDLDELFSRYIEPMNDLVSVMLKHRSFQPGSEAEVNAIMFARRADSPQRIPYFFRFEPNKPGVFTLTWLSLNIKSENPVKNLRVEVRPYGLRAQGEVFARPSDLIVWFKETQESQAAAHVAAKQKAAARSTHSTASAVAHANASHQQAYGSAPLPPPPPAAPTVRKSRWEQA